MAGIGGDRLGNFTRFTNHAVPNHAICGLDVLMFENIVYFALHPLILVSNDHYISYALKTATFTADSGRNIIFLSDSLFAKIKIE